VQFALLMAVRRDEGLDQRTIAGKIGFDTSTIGAVVDRLESRGLVRRMVALEDKRVRLLSLTPEGETLLKRVIPAMLRAQERMLEPLAQADRPRFMRMIRRIVDGNNAFSRAAKEAG
jgi:DNA-binding MarR family transcriptional regulator